MSVVRDRLDVLAASLTCIASQQACQHDVEVLKRSAAAQQYARAVLPLLAWGETPLHSDLQTG